ncbi:MAG TPA: glycosyltransferase family 4 protein [Candidatus Limnocylindrales bacterium]|nr:glycosyltransferase family 4 protein [Candidatus Limnocylindrales bacterium]
MKRRILVLNERDVKSPLAGGAEIHIFEIFRRLVERGHEVTLLAATYPGCAREEMVQGVRVRRLVNRYPYYAVAPWVARREARRGGYDVVVDVLNKIPFLSPWFVNVPCFAIVHHLFGTTAFRQVNIVAALITWLSEKLIPYVYRGVPMLAISPSTKEDLIDRGVVPAQIWVVPPGVDQDTHVAPDDGLSRRPIVLWIGRLEKYKSTDHMVDAMAGVVREVPDARLVFVGAGTARPALEAKVRELGLSQYVEFTGFVPEEEKLAWLGRAAVVVQTSEKEGWGMTVIEGNACGTPAVASNVKGLRDSVRHGETGLLYEYGDTEALARSIVAVLTDRELRARLIAGGRAWGERFSWDRVTDDTAALIEEAIARTGSHIRLKSSPFEP